MVLWSGVLRQGEDSIAFGVRKAEFLFFAMEDEPHEAGVLRGAKAERRAVPQGGSGQRPKRQNVCSKTSVQ